MGISDLQYSTLQLFYAPVYMGNILVLTLAYLKISALAFIFFNVKIIDFSYFIEIVLRKSLLLHLLFSLLSSINFFQRCSFNIIYNYTLSSPLAMMICRCSVGTLRFHRSIHKADKHNPTQDVPFIPTF